ncbi:MAG: MFS transporter [Gemmatimonadota bacterium]|nr:MFS transporter [Gemmatimonadota bacterium]
MPAPAPRIPTRAVASWVLYDLANTIFSMGVVSLYFSLYVRDAVGEQRADSTYGVITAISMGIIFVISPLLGAMTDRARRRMPFLVWSTIVCCACTALLARGSYLESAALFIVGNAAYQAGLQFYDALLPEVTTEENRGRIGGIGIGVGYLGSYLAVGIGLLLGTRDKPLLFTIIALAFLVFAVPCFVFVKERGNPNPRPVFGLGVIRESTAQTLQTLREGHKYPGLLRFLVGRVFYTDAINTVIAYMSLYTVNVAVSTGLTAEQGEKSAQLILMSAITCAVIGGFAWGWIVDRIGPKRTLNLVLLMWLETFALAAAIGLLHLPIGWLYLVACQAGVALGGVWSADRPYMLRLTPPDRVGEFYGLYGMVGRFSAVTGPVLWSVTTWLVVQRMGAPAVTGQAIAIITLLAMVLVSHRILRHVSDTPRDWEALRGAGPPVVRPIAM